LHLQRILVQFRDVRKYKGSIEMVMTVLGQQSRSLQRRNADIPARSEARRPAL